MKLFKIISIQGDGSDNSGRNTPQSSSSPKTTSPTPPSNLYSSLTMVPQISSFQPTLTPSRFSGVDSSRFSGYGVEQMSPGDRFKILQYAEIMKRCCTGLINLSFKAL